MTDLDLDSFKGYTEGEWEAFKVGPCDCGTHKEHWNVRIGEHQITRLSEADAKLIAAVPTMHKTLIKWAKLLDRYDRLMDSMPVDLDDIIPEDGEDD